MTQINVTLPTTDQSLRMEQYYRLHSKIYDATRWSFLFGRRQIIDKVAALRTPSHILEVGCGTGKNLVALGQTFPQAKIIGLDISESMLSVARKNLGSMTKRISLLCTSYDQSLKLAQSFDLILFSYSLTMMNPGWDQAIEQAYHDLADDGLIAAVDFHNSRLTGFKKWMAVNHVRMDGHIYEKLNQRFSPEIFEVQPAYGFLWQYFLFAGKK
ncbi:MAG: methyltransferase domain-containing protein [Anaerolineae bacterium]|nr:methyltransferase domain-containing protein [Anaerolineae bacterium]MCB9107569.1 methyltransferase domain-containing protein [Anaerolineales bacterium]